jgi:alanine racemase
MEQLTRVAMRLELKAAIGDCSLINDSYNSDLGSLSIALDFLAQQKQHARRTLILSDILQSGRSDADLYEDVAGLLEQKGVTRLVGIGRNISREKDIFLKNPDLKCQFFPTTEDFMDHFLFRGPNGSQVSFHDETILLKGARVFQFERVSKLLEQKTHQTVLEINLNALTHNLKTYQTLLRPGVKTMAMVKAFSYGSGTYEVANLLQFHQVDYLAVAYADEGIALRQKGIVLPIMVMNPEPGTFNAIIQWNLEPEIYSRGLLNAFEEELRQAGRASYPVHVKLDTGMHRLGFSEEELEGLKNHLVQESLVRVVSVFSHLAASGDPALKDFTMEQAARFEKMSAVLTGALSYPVIRHLSNSAAIPNYPELQYDMVRLGIGLYGIDETNQLQSSLEVVTTLKTTISQLRRVPAGDTVGYSRAGKVDTDKTIATVSVGYADGYLRALGNGKGKMLLRGEQAPVIGNICMDMLMLDVSDIPEAREGDPVVVFGEEPTIAQVAGWAGTIPYEIMTGISGRVKRIYVQE